MSERRRNAFWGVLFGYGSVAVSLVRNILLVPVYLRSIDLPEYGAWLATGGALALLLVNDFGLAGVVTQRASAAIGARDFKLFGSLSGSALFIGGLLALMLTGISLLCLPLLTSLDSLPAAQRHAVRDCYVLAIGANAAGILGSAVISILRSLQRSIMAGAITLLADIANILATLIGIFAGAGLYAIAGGLLVRALLIAGAGFAAVYLLFRRSLGLAFEVRWGSIRVMIADSARFFVTSIAMKMQAQANVFFVGAVLGPQTAGIYGLTVRAHETVLMLTGQINGALVPSITHLVGSGNLERFRAVILRVLLTMAAVTAFAMTVTVTSNAVFLRLWVGGQVFGGQPVSILMAFALFVSSLGYVAYDALIAQGRFRLVSSVFAATSTLHVALLLSLMRWGLWTAPAVTLVTAGLWGMAFWRSIRQSFALTTDELAGLLGQLAVIIAVSVGIGALFMLYYPVVTSWRALTLQVVLCMFSLGMGYALFSTTLRSLAREEIGLTMRLFGSN
jgi:O-antigen/teichoic acid export membrane protein